MQTAIYQSSLSNAYHAFDAARFDSNGLGANPVSRERIICALFWLDNALQFVVYGDIRRADYCVNCAVHFLRKIH